MRMLKKVGYGLVLWVVPYATAIPLLPLMQRDLVFFKTIMIVEGTLVGGVLTALYFLRVERNFLREGIVLAAVWIVVNWALDFVALLPFTKMPLDRYFIEIGARYLAMAAPTVVAGFLLERRSRA
jgi:uncharacterized membrane protein YpjA